MQQNKVIYIIYPLERNQDFAKRGAWKWKFLWRHQNDVIKIKILVA